MIKKILLWLFLLGWVGTGLTIAQDKIGYLNMELVLSYMPETQSMAQSLRSTQEKLASQMKVKEEYGQTKVEEYLQKREGGASEADLKPLEDEIRKLEQELKAFAAEAEQKVAIKRQELMAPITEKLKGVIDEMAEKEGYDYILNSVDGSAVSVILHGPETNDITIPVMEALGIDVPEEAKQTEN